MSMLNTIFNIFKENKKLVYAVNIFILLVIISLILKFNTTNLISSNTSENASAFNSSDNNKITTDSYVYAMEKRMEEILGKIEGIKSVDVMLYTKKTPEMEPIYDENTSLETNNEIGSEGMKREVNRETKQNQVVIGNNNQVVEKYYQYPEISGVLVVVDYDGNKDIYTILMNSIKTLFDINVNDIEVVY
ncbi:hypothetical protein [Sedimentibacter sp. MB31-C6]|uniref:hypothetical protein n=1 Tax=Sedimentibacter sp. MB31-C6 TaxID=3109366 RepID=UPI002DDD8040|nr:hypothetical protein [Sedimentibacter sp. MB36-C1]WSI04185.1 hypothetical protein U8307_14465 [Sedimentibacter sp. MB36-C1]WSI05636.1 hypothetical protein U8307_14565 [Sedimentibacter sp. MB36-C1]